jgi:hypothetical protein
VRVVGDRPGQASALKMCYAALTKGTTALMTELSIAAERLGVSAALRAEFAESQPAMLERMQRAVPAMVPKAHRWVGEMAEIARTFEACGLTPRTFEGAAELYPGRRHRARPDVARRLAPAGRYLRCGREQARRRLSDAASGPVGRLDAAKRRGQQAAQTVPHARRHRGSLRA